MCLFGKRGDGAAAPADVRLKINFDDADDLIIEAEGRRFRLAWEVMLALVEKRKPEKKEIPFDAAAIEKYIKLERLLLHGLDFSRIARLMGEPEDALRSFYGWAAGHPFSKDAPVKIERARQAALDVLPLVKPFDGPDGMHTEVRLVGRDVVLALQRNGGSVRETAKAIGLDPADLEKWLESNADIMAALK